MSHTKINGSMKSLYHQFYECARMYWRDMRYSGLDAIEKSKRRAYEVAAQRVGFPLSLCDRLFATCFDERLVPNGRMYDMATHISGCVALTYKPPTYQPAMCGRPFVLLDPFDEERNNRPSAANRAEERERAMLERPFFLIDPLFEEAAA